MDQVPDLFTLLYVFSVRATNSWGVKYEYLGGLYSSGACSVCCCGGAVKQCPMAVESNLDKPQFPQQFAEMQTVSACQSRLDSF